MRISVAMATYNGGKYIREQLESLANQSTLPFELVICDDGSNDNTLEIIEELTKELPFNVYIYKNKENLQFTGNFLKSASLCSGDAIAFCDQDDIWDNRKIEICANALKSQQADLVIHEGRVVDGDGRPTLVKIPDFSGNLEHIKKAPFDCISKGFAMIVRRQVIEELLLFWDWHEYTEFKKKYGPPLGHDLLIYALCVDRKKIFYIKHELVNYRIHGENVTASVNITNNSFERFINFFNGLVINESNYYLPAKKWRAEVEFLRAYVRRSTIGPHQGVIQLADWLSRKSQLWFDRSVIYDKQSPRKQRWMKLASLLYSGGYVSSLKPRLGLGSFCKDFIVLFIR